MEIISVAGQYRGVGKTEFAQILLSRLTNFSALKVTVDYPGRCQVSGTCRICRDLKSPYKIIEDGRIILKKNTDTARLKKSGAKEVKWLITKEKFLKKGLSESIKKFEKCSGIVVEGNSFLKTNKAGLSFLVSDGSDKNIKPSAKAILNKIDAVVMGKNYG